MKTKFTVILLATALLAGFASAAPVYMINFDHGVQSPNPTTYTAGTGEVLPTGVTGVCAAPDTANPFVTSTGTQGGEMWQMGRGAGWPNEQGYRFDGGPGIEASWTMEFLLTPDYTNTGFGGTTSAVYKGAPAWGNAGSHFVYINWATGKITWDNSFYDPGGYEMVSTTTLAAGTYYHVAVVARATGVQATQQMELWINGVLEDTTSFPVGWETVYGIPTNFALGSWYNYTTRNFQGGIDAFCIDDTALTRGHFNLPAPFVPIEDPELSRGRQILLKKGLQIQAMAWPYTGTEYWGFNENLFAASNFTTVNLNAQYSSGLYYGPPNDLQWGKWAYYTDEYELHPAEVDHIQDLITYQYRDEQGVGDPTQLQLVTDWLEFARQAYPNVISFSNQYGWQNSYAEMRNYMLVALPDMLMFDNYPFDDNGDFWGELYRDMQKYRLLGLGGIDGTGTMPIPYGLYTDTWVQKGHRPSESEMRVNEFSAWAFGYTLVNAFVYTAPADSLPSVLFTGYGDSNPTVEFWQMAALNKESRNLGPALICLTSTDVRMIMGTGYPLPSGLSTWNSSVDPYLTAISAQNLGSKNGGNPGTVIIGYFRPLLESLDGPSYENEMYFMIVNALSDPVGLASETQQEIRVDFDFGSSGISSLQRLSRYTGLVEEVPLIHDTGSVYHIFLTLDGGTGDLFKFNTGAPFVMKSDCRGALAGDIWGPDDEPDCVVDWYDITKLASDWLKTDEDVLNPGVNPNTVYLMNFDHGVQSPNPTPYTAGTGEVLPAGVTGVCPNPNSANPFVSSTGLQGGEAWQVGLGAAWPNEQGYRLDGGPGIGTAYMIGGWAMEFLINPDYTNTGYGLSQVSTLYKGKPAFGSYGAHSVYLDQTTHKIVWANGFTYSFPDMYSNTLLDAGTWYHVAVVARATGDTATGQMMELWINGFKEDTSPFPVGWEAIYGIPTDFSVGSAYNYTGRNFQGQIDAFSIVNAALDATNFALPAPEVLPVYLLDFDHGVQNPGPDPYIADANEVLPGTMVIYGVTTDATELQDSSTDAFQGGQSLTMLQGASSPIFAGYRLTGGPIIPARTDGTQGFTVEALINPDYTDTGYGLTANSTIYKSRDNGAGARAQGLYLDQTTGKIRFFPGMDFTGEGGWTNLYSATALQAGTWYHIAVVCDAVTNTLALYINGVPETMKNFADTWEDELGFDSTLYIGNEAGTNGRNFQGQIDAFAIRDFAIDAYHGFYLPLKPACTDVLAGDLNNDCIVNLKDISILADNWQDSILQP